MREDTPLEVVIDKLKNNLIEEYKDTCFLHFQFSGSRNQGKSLTMETLKAAMETHSSKPEFPYQVYPGLYSQTKVMSPRYQYSVTPPMLMPVFNDADDIEKAKEKNVLIDDERSIEL